MSILERFHPSLDIAEQLFGGERELDVEEELEGCEDGEAPEHHWQVEEVAYITPVLPFPDTPCNLCRQHSSSCQCLCARI